MHTSLSHSMRAAEVLGQCSQCTADQYNPKVLLPPHLCERVHCLAVGVNQPGCDATSTCAQEDARQQDT
jgi:hypothetical protein